MHAYDPRFDGSRLRAHLTVLFFELYSFTDEKDRAIQAHRTLRNLMASLVTGGPVPIWTPMAPIDRISGAANTSNPLLPSRKRLREEITSQAQTAPKRVTRSLMSTPNPKRLMNGKIARSQDPPRSRDR